MPTLVKITLNGFVRRTLNSDVLKAAIKSTGAKLTRKGRSRNWQLHANNNQIRQISTFIYQSEESSWLWLAKKINEEKPKLSQDEIRAIIKESPTISVNQLISLTDCSLSDARRILDEVEWEPD